MRFTLIEGIHFEVEAAKVLEEKLAILRVGGDEDLWVTFVSGVAYERR